MQIWVDACPNVIKEILFRAAERLQIRTTLVANQFVRTPPSLYIKTIQVQAGFDVADNRDDFQWASPHFAPATHDPTQA